MVYKKIHYSFHGAFIIPWKTHDATFMVINGEIQHFHELIMGISWEICLVVKDSLDNSTPTCPDSDY